MKHLGSTDLWKVARRSVVEGHRPLASSVQIRVHLLGVAIARRLEAIASRLEAIAMPRQCPAVVVAHDPRLKAQFRSAHFPRSGVLDSLRYAFGRRPEGMFAISLIQTAWASVALPAVANKSGCGPRFASWCCKFASTRHSWPTTVTPLLRYLRR